MEKKYLTLQEHQEILYELLYKLDDFCKENNIRYFLAFGSLLGAIRHGGIIPWDDDVDVMMERDEYDRFEKLITKNPIPGYKAYSINNTKDYYYPFIKFGKLGTKLVEKEWKCVPKEGIGINIDVFPVDGCPNDFEEAKKYVTNLTNEIFWNIRFWTSVNWRQGKNLKQKLYYFIWTRSALRRILLKKLYKKTTKYKLDNSKMFYPFWSFYGTRNLLYTEMISNLVLHPFGSRKLPVPSDYDKILKNQYGDYMKPPSEEKKQSTHKNEVYIEIL